MSTTQTSNETATSIPGATVDLKLEAIPIPVSDVDRAIRFYESLGWKLDADFWIGKNFRAVQLTPPGSQCSIHLATTAVPGSAQGMFLVVSDIEAARSELIAHGVDVTGVFHFDGDHQPVPGPDPGGNSYFSYASFADPDGNRWVLQEVKTINARQPKIQNNQIGVMRARFRKRGHRICGKESLVVVGLEKHLIPEAHIGVVLDDKNPFVRY